MAVVEPSVDFNAFAGSETGLLKGLSVTPKTCLAKNFKGSAGKALLKEEEITCLALANGGKDVLVGMKNRLVRTFNPADKAFTESLTCTVNGEADGPLRGVARVDSVLVTAAESGVVKLWRYKDGVEVNTVDVAASQSKKLRRGKDFSGEEEMLKHVASMKADRTLSCMRACSSGSVVATGGRENDVQLWDLSRPEAPVFHAKNVPPNFLQLRVPVWVGDVCFPEADSSAVVASVNRHGHVRLYDSRLSGQRRPVLSLDFADSTLTAMSATPDSKQVRKVKRQINTF